MCFMVLFSIELVRLHELNLSNRVIVVYMGKMRYLVKI